MSIQNIFRSNNLTNPLFDVHCDELFCNNINLSDGISLSGGTIYATNVIASNNVHASNSVSTSGNLITNEITAEGNITCLSTILSDIVNANNVNADQITSSGSIQGDTILGTTSITSSGSLMAGTALVNGALTCGSLSCSGTSLLNGSVTAGFNATISNILTTSFFMCNSHSIINSQAFTISGNLSLNAAQSINTTIAVSSAVANTILTLPSATAVLAAIPFALVGSIFHIYVVNNTAFNVKFAASGDGTFFLTYTDTGIGPTSAGFQTRGVFTCKFESVGGSPTIRMY